MPNQAAGKRSLTDLTYHKLKRCILTGKIPPGKKLVVNDIVDEWKISNTPIKEALNRLLSEGLVVFEPRRGMRVRRPLTVKEVREKYELRAVLETHCCPLAVAAIGEKPGVIEEMRQILDEIGAKLHDERHYVELYQLDADFHKCLVRFSNNREMMQLHEQLSLSIATFGILASEPNPLRNQQMTHTEHKAILEALKEKNEAKLMELVRCHLIGSMRHLLEFYADSSTKTEGAGGGLSVQDAG